MATWTPPSTLSAGAVLPTAYYNAIANDVLFLYQAPYIHAYDNTGTSCPAATDTEVTLSGVVTSGYGFSLSGNSVVIPLTGIYSVSWCVTYTLGASGGDSWVGSHIYHNGGVSLQGAQVYSQTGVPASSGSGILSCSATDTLNLDASNNSGSTLTTAPLSGSTFIAVYFIGSV